MLVVRLFSKTELMMCRRVPGLVTQIAPPRALSSWVFVAAGARPLMKRIFWITRSLPEVLSICEPGVNGFSRIRVTPPPSRVINPFPSITISRVADVTSGDVIGIVTGLGPQSKVMCPPFVSAA
jgi:hypothetical protein